MLINKYIERFKFLGIAIILLLSAVMVESNFFEQHFNQSKAERFQNVLNRKIDGSAQIISQIEKLCSGSDPFAMLDTFYLEKKQLFEKHGISFIVYRDSNCLYWSDNSMYFPRKYTPSFFYKNITFIDHGWFYLNKKNVKNFNIIVLLNIKSEYPYQNKLLPEEFQSDFSIAPSVKISVKNSQNEFPVLDRSGKFLFSLSNNKDRNTNVFQRNFAVMLYFLSFMTIIFFMGNYLKKFRRLWIADLTNVGFFVFIFIVRWLMVSYRFPFIFRIVPLFDPQYFALSSRFPSLGDLLIDSMFLWYFIYQLHHRLKHGLLFRYNQRVGRILVFVFPLLICIFGFFVDLCIKSLVVDSNINFEAHKVLDISNMSVFGYLIMAILIHCFVMVSHGFIYSVSKRYDFQSGLLIFLPGFIVSLLILINENVFFVLRISILMLIMFFVLFAVNYKNKGDFSFTFKVLIIFISSIFITLSIDYYYQSKQLGIKKIYAQNLADEHDALTEQMIRETEMRLQDDQTLQTFMKEPSNKEDVINKYLRNKYFGGFLNRYRLETTVCGNSSYFIPENNTNNCESYFKHNFFDHSESLNDSRFSFVKNKDGSISYVSKISFPVRNDTMLLFVELRSKLLTEELGYPELLINEKNFPKNIFKEFSYARYKNGKLVNQKGEFQYSLSSDFATSLVTEFSLFSYGRFDHLFYKVPGETGTVIVVSAHKTSLIQLIIGISYVFLFFFLLLMLMEFVLAMMMQSISFKMNFKGKIQASFIGVLVLSLVLIGISMIYLNLDQYKKAQYDHVSDKLQSITVDLEQYGERKNLSNFETDENITYKLRRLSNIYFTDVNLYDLDGNLITSSRTEIYDWGLTGTKMNIEALSALSSKKYTSFHDIEKIGKLEYLSAYGILKNKNNEPIAYVNIPYFTKQDALTQRLSSLIVAFINIYVLLIVIATLIAVFISNKITRPLFILKEKIRHIKLRGKNENIEWESNDEIGSLINDYNRMVRELTASAEKLAENEREMAWREMAKQIAHEIKNPLTPMKLSIQLLNRAWDSNDKEFEQRLKKVSETLLEQIDNLAATATEFSNFAKISNNSSEDVNIIERLNHCVDLFSNEQDITFDKQYKSSDSFVVIFDKDKMNRIFINIIKNAIQAIPSDKKAEISIGIDSKDNCYIVKISDNGSGIDSETQKRLFEPNFTTKSSGSGLGLAICRNIVKNFGGDIWFETKMGQGSTFYISFAKKIQQ